MTPTQALELTLTNNSQETEPASIEADTERSLQLIERLSQKWRSDRADLEQPGGRNVTGELRSLLVQRDLELRRQLEGSAVTSGATSGQPSIREDGDTGAARGQPSIGRDGERSDPEDETWSDCSQESGPDDVYTSTGIFHEEEQSRQNDKRRHGEASAQTSSLDGDGAEAENQICSKRPRPSDEPAEAKHQWRVHLQHPVDEPRREAYLERDTHLHARRPSACSSSDAWVHNDRLADRAGCATSNVGVRTEVAGHIGRSREERSRRPWTRVDAVEEDSRRRSERPRPSPPMNDAAEAKHQWRVHLQHPVDEPRREAHLERDPPRDAHEHVRVLSRNAAPPSASLPIPEASVSDGHAPVPPRRLCSSQEDLPSFEAMQAVGYLETAAVMRGVWTWARSHSPTDGVWPTPTNEEQAKRTQPCPSPPHEASGPLPIPSVSDLVPFHPSLCGPTPTCVDQEAMTFNACGWPAEHTTPAEWLPMLQYWTVLREQLINGAPRRARSTVTATLSGRSSGHR